MLVGIMELVVGGQHGTGGHHVGARLVKGHRVKGGQDTEVGDECRVVVVPAVAFRAYVHDEADVEIRFVLEHGLGVFRNLVIQALRRVPVSEHGGVMLAEGDTLAASHAMRIVDHSLMLAVEAEGLVGAVAHTDAASHTMVASDFGLDAP